MEDSHGRSRIKRKNDRKVLQDVDCVLDKGIVLRLAFVNTVIKLNKRLDLL